MAADNSNQTIMFTQEQIQARAKEIGAQITRDFAGEPVLVVGVLKGAMMWMADIVKAIDLDVYIDFIWTSSYGSDTETSGRVRVIKDVEADLTGRNVILLDDIVDTGITMQYLKNYFEGRGPKCVKTCTMLDKPERRRVQVEPDYNGFSVEDRFIIGYGLDYAQKYRNLPYISYID